MELSPSAAGALVVAAIVVGLVAIGLAAAALQGQRRVRETYARFSIGRDHDVISSIAHHVDVVEALRGDVADLRAYADALRALIAQGISKAATVRYDAYDDMGGRMSFSTALLDERGDGVVITSISGRMETRTYAKTVTGTESTHNLSSEEATAIRRALAGKDRTPARRPSRNGRGTSPAPGAVTPPLLDPEHRRWGDVGGHGEVEDLSVAARDHHDEPAGARRATRRPVRSGARPSR